jgi:hypothetical protein
MQMNDHPIHPMELWQVHSIQGFYLDVSAAHRPHRNRVHVSGPQTYAVSRARFNIADRVDVRDPGALSLSSGGGGRRTYAITAVVALYFNCSRAAMKFHGEPLHA